MAWTHAAFPIVREKFGLVGRHIDVHGTVAFAAFASQAEVKRFFDVLVAPAFSDDGAMQHLPEMMGAAARGVPLFMSEHEAGTHGVPVSGLGIFSAAFANADAAQRRVSKAAIVLRIFEVGGRVPGMVIGAEPQILVDAIRIHDLAGIHLPAGVPDGFEFAKGLDELRAKHLAEELGFRLAVAMLAAEAAAVFHAEIGRLFHERPPLPYSGSAGEVKAYAAVHASLAKVAVHRRVVFIFV